MPSRDLQLLLIGMENPRFYLCAIIMLISGLLVWGACASIDQVVRVEGKIIPAGRSQKIQHLEGGIIAGINVAEGSVVQRGDLLLTIDSTTAQASLSETQVQLNSQRAKQARLEAELSDKQKVDFPDDIKNLPVVNAEQDLFTARRSRLEHEILVRQNTIKQRLTEIDDASNRRSHLRNELVTASQRVEMMEAMLARGAASKVEVLDARSREQRLKSEIGEVEGSVPKAQAAINEEQSRINALRADFKALAQNDLVVAIAEIDRFKKVIAAAADRLNRTEVRAPIDGIINRISVNTVGGVVKPGDSLIELIPSTRDILVEARAHLRDRGLLRAGLSAEVRFSAYDAGEYGFIKGRVTEVSADSFQDSRSEPYYQVNILVETLPPLYAGRAMVPGMTATADIVAGSRTLLGYLLSPLRKFSYNMFRDPR